MTNDASVTNSGIFLNVQAMQTTSNHTVLDLAGIGIGPSNLSLAALLKPHRQIDCRFFERRNEFQWHAGLMFPHALLQVSYLKDLVSLVDPTNELSFLSFLARHKRLLSFVNAGFPRVSRREFNQYYRWACEQLPYLTFGTDVEAVTVEGNAIVLHGRGWSQATRNLSLGLGRQPTVPECTARWLGATMLHASRYLLDKPAIEGKRVVIVGGGQTGAEILAHILADTDALPASVAWISRRTNFAALDESSFVNELFTPSYSDYFYGLSDMQRRDALSEQRMASDGISPSLLQSIYQQVYELRHVLRHPCLVALKPGRELIDVAQFDRRWALKMRHAQRADIERLDADVVILCTGYAHTIPTLLDPIRDRIKVRDNEIVVHEDYSVDWVGPAGCHIFVQNAAINQRGIADPNLGLVAWRSAKIINSVARQPIYDLTENASFVSWDIDRSPELEAVGFVDAEY
jgi:lysine N6-hydroxylase